MYLTFQQGSTCTSGSESLAGIAVNDLDISCLFRISVALSSVRSTYCSHIVGFPKPCSVVRFPWENGQPVRAFSFARLTDFLANYGLLKGFTLPSAAIQTNEVKVKRTRTATIHSCYFLRAEHSQFQKVQRARRRPDFEY